MSQEIQIQKKEALEEMHQSPEFKAQKKYFMRITNDAYLLLKLAFMYSSRAYDFSKNALSVQSTDDLAQSIQACSYLFDEGLITPVKRELRYIIESSIKYLYADQQTKGKNLQDKITFLQSIGSSIDVREDLNLSALHEEDAKLLINELNDVYRECCAYVHVSPRQVSERLDQRERGGALGYETTDELRKLNKLIFRVYDMALALYFHGYDLSMTGDLFVGALDDMPKWSFHKGKYVSTVSAYFDYKHERNMRKYGEARPWDAKNWPPRKLNKA
ncbi:hypothetical protein [Methylomonas albis]|uniref:HEPN AbiU2-like domain-containing protein n=1 Tax=Methylomonas albis TaxID=1854563 RepID=A0ABR9D749_9GAMM|nr:hypothetical protein [Methylomonas albis]MBD9358932.1 hypothetical protein [Methylomonas albis]